MMLLNQQVKSYIEKSSWIRKMFEKGAELKARLGEDKVFDFSLGNPDLVPPKTILDAFLEIKQKASEPLGLGYMPNAGLPALREKLAHFFSQEQGVQVQAKHIVITSGAAGGLNTLFRAILEPGDEVIVWAPFFVEYGFYAENHQGKLKIVKTKEKDFSLDFDQLDEVITPKTRVVLINSPNNPCGQIYTLEELKTLASILERKTRTYGREIFLVSDEPYRFLTYEDTPMPSILPLYTYSVVVSSFSKSLGLAGERIGYVVVNPEMPQSQDMVSGLTLTNRILGFVNAPIIGQYLLLAGLGQMVDVQVYKKRRQMLGDILQEAGLNFLWPKGGFYFFPEAPNKKEDEFIHALLEENVLAVPGKGFGWPGNVRFAFCVPEKVILNSKQAIFRAVNKLKN
ncbi:MAG: pyridoxal phosphate-dependent aminotransferase [Desulfonauticus sp.]|nr:pyridoxal phosphate-dependent aminotransferase [Desulfonauticus sp.]